MSRILGRVNDVLQTVNYIQSSNIPKYKRNNEITTWNNVEDVPKKISMYLPDSTIDFINKEKITLLKNPLRKYTFTSIPEDETEKRYIVFPSYKPIKEFEREYAFYIGGLLSYYQIDTQEEFLENGKEFDDLLPLLIDYLYLKSQNKEKEFSLKYLYLMKRFSKNFNKTCRNYTKLNEFLNNAETHNLDDKEYKCYRIMVEENDEEMEKLTIENIVKLSAIDGVLQIADKILSNNEYKELIEKLMINEDENRSSILYENGIDTYGYKRLKKEIDKYKMT